MHPNLIHTCFSCGGGVEGGRGGGERGRRGGLEVRRGEEQVREGGVEVIRGGGEVRVRGDEGSKSPEKTVRRSSFTSSSSDWSSCCRELVSMAVAPFTCTDKKST